MTTVRYLPPSRPASLDAVFARIGAVAPLDPEDKVFLGTLGDWRSDPPGARLVRGGDEDARLLTQGWAARVRWLGDGRRQIFNFHLAGDLLQLPLRTATDAAIVALTAVQTVDAGLLIHAARTDRAGPALIRAVEESDAFDASLIMDQVVRLGRLQAYERMAHLILELYRRAVSAGLAVEGRMPFPLTQEMLADATGLSIVHVNRMLQRLRTERLVDVRHGQLALINHSGLSDLCALSADPNR